MSAEWLDLLVWLQGALSATGACYLYWRHCDQHFVAVAAQAGVVVMAAGISCSGLVTLDAG